MSLSRLEAEVQNAVYAATEMFEVLEHTGHFRGNGHHARQEAAAAVAKILNNRWESIARKMARATGGLSCVGGGNVAPARRLTLSTGVWPVNRA